MTTNSLFPSRAIRATRRRSGLAIRREDGDTPSMRTDSFGALVSVPVVVASVPPPWGVPAQPESNIPVIAVNVKTAREITNSLLLFTWTLPSVFARCLFSLQPDIFAVPPWNRKVPLGHQLPVSAR